MVDEQPQLHDLTKFLLSRKETYPEEFADGRWDKQLDTVRKHGGEADRRALGFVPQRRAMNNALRSALQELLVPEESSKTPLTAREALVQRLAPQLNAAFRTAYHNPDTQQTIVEVINKDTGAGTRLLIRDDISEKDPSLKALLGEALKP